MSGKSCDIFFGERREVIFFHPQRVSLRGHSPNKGDRKLSRSERVERSGEKIDHLSDAMKCTLGILVHQSIALYILVHPVKRMVTEFPREGNLIPSSRGQIRRTSPANLVELFCGGGVTYHLKRPCQRRVDL